MKLYHALCALACIYHTACAMDTYKESLWLRLTFNQLRRAQEKYLNHNNHIPRVIIIDEEEVQEEEREEFKWIRNYWTENVNNLTRNHVTHINKKLKPLIQSNVDITALLWDMIDMTKCLTTRDQIQPLSTLFNSLARNGIKIFELKHEHETLIEHVLRIKHWALVNLLAELRN